MKPKDPENFREKIEDFIGDIRYELRKIRYDLDWQMRRAKSQISGSLYRTTFAEVLKTGVLGLLKTGITIEHVKCALGKPDTIHEPKGVWFLSYESIEINCTQRGADWTVWYFKLPLKYFNRLPPNILFSGYFPKPDTTLPEFEDYLRENDIEYVVLWQNIKETRYPIVHIRPGNLYIQFDEDTLKIGSLYCYRDLTDFKVHLASHVALTLFDIVNEYILQAKKGLVFPYGYPYYLGGNENAVRPFVSYKADRFSVTQLIDLGIPDFAVAVIIPHTNMEDLLTTISRCFEAGTKEFWIIYPSLRELHQYKGSEPNTVRIYRGSERIDAEDLFPGIEGLTTDNIFKLPKWAMQDKGEDS